MSDIPDQYIMTPASTFPWPRFKAANSGHPQERYRARTRPLVGRAKSGIACTGLPRPIRDALVSWNHGTVYELPHWQSYSSGGGKGLFEKTYDLGELFF